MTVFGGKSGYLINTRNICSHRPVVAVGYVGQNNKTSKQKVKVKTACGKKKKRTKRKSR
jgi:hypothetical protein